jgi:hypothetical protein
MLFIARYGRPRPIGGTESLVGKLRYVASVNEVTCGSMLRKQEERFPHPLVPHPCGYFFTAAPCQAGAHKPTQQHHRAEFRRRQWRIFRLTHFIVCYVIRNIIIEQRKVSNQCNT